MTMTPEEYSQYLDQKQKEQDQQQYQGEDHQQEQQPTQDNDEKGTHESKDGSDGNQPSHTKDSAEEQKSTSVQGKTPVARKQQHEESWTSYYNAWFTGKTLDDNSSATSPLTQSPSSSRQSKRHLPMSHRIGRIGMEVVSVWKEFLGCADDAERQAMENDGLYKRHDDDERHKRSASRSKTKKRKSKPMDSSNNSVSLSHGQHIV